MFDVGMLGRLCEIELILCDLSGFAHYSREIVSFGLKQVIKC